MGPMNSFIFSLAFLTVIYFVSAKNVHHMEIDKMDDADLIKLLLGPKQKIPRNGDFAWGNCRDNDPVKVKAMNMIPDPVKAGPASINMTLLVTQDMVDPLIGKASLKLQDGSSWDDLCQYVNCNLGDLCTYLEKVKTCPKALTDAKLNCKCPIKANTYNIVNLPISNIPEFPITGIFNATLDISSNGKHVACSWFKFRYD